MELFRINPFLVYDHEQGLFMIYEGKKSTVRLLPRHFVTNTIQNDNGITLVCDSKHHKENIDLSSDDPENDIDAIEYIIHTLK